MENRPALNRGLELSTARFLNPKARLKSSFNDSRVLST